ncbi:MAG: PHP domain-containing protein [Armatimonadota bacterium]
METLNPYDGAFDRAWFKGDVHIHTTASDGRADREQVLARLRECGFDFAAIADHDLHTPGDDAGDPVLLPNCEFNTPQGDVLSLFAEVARPEVPAPQDVIDAVNAAGGFPVIAHPKLREFRHDAADRAVSSSNLIRDLSGYAAIEVYTHNIGSGFQMAIDRLDAVWTWRVSEGRAPVGVWGLATSDSHDLHTITPDVGIMVAAEECTGAALREAIERGAFYALAASRARFREISTRGCSLRFVAEGAEVLQLFGVPQAEFSAERRRLAIAWADGRDLVEIDYEVTGSEGFVRAEAMDRAGNLIVANPIEIRA